MSTGANILSTLELEEDGLDVKSIQVMVSAMHHAVASQFPTSRERTYVLEIINDAYPREE
jgi:hypothetical protein